MSRGLNKVMIIGNLGVDPEVRYMPSGGSVTNIRVATSEVWKDKQTGERQERTEWHRIVLFNRLGEIAAQYLRKGSRVYIEGSIRTNKWKDQTGNDRYTTEIIASDIQLLDSKGSGGGAGSAPAFDEMDMPQDLQGTSGNANASAQRPSGSPKATANKAPAVIEEEFDDDIPF